MPQILKIASVQARTLSTTAATLQALEQFTKHAKTIGVDILLFPEAYLGGYPRTCSFGSSIGARTEEGRDQFLQYFHQAVDLGDTPGGAGSAWTERRLELPKGQRFRGDGTREQVERIARETGVFIVTGLVERCAGTLYCGVVFVCPIFGVLGKRRKVMPTGSERLVWGQGSPATLRAVTTNIKGVRICMGAAICWENYMPLLRQSLYSQNVNLWLAPTADARNTWEALMKTIGVEGRCVVVSANQCVRENELPEWIAVKQADAGGEARSGGTEPAGASRSRQKSIVTTTEDEHEIIWPVVEGKVVTQSREPDGATSTPSSQQPIEPTTKADLSIPPQQFESESGQDSRSSSPFVCRGGSCIISPFGETLAGPLWEKQDELLVADVDFEDCEKGRLDLDVAGSYGRLDSFHLTVDGLNLDPPP